MIFDFLIIGFYEILTLFLLRKKNNVSHQKNIDIVWYEDSEIEPKTLIKRNFNQITLLFFSNITNKKS